MSLRQDNMLVGIARRHAAEAIALLARIGLAFTFWLVLFSVILWSV